MFDVHDLAQLSFSSIRQAWQMPYKLSTSQVPVRYKELGIDMTMHAAIFAPADSNGYGACYAHMGSGESEFTPLSSSTIVFTNDDDDDC